MLTVELVVGPKAVVLVAEGRSEVAAALARRASVARAWIVEAWTVKVWVVEVWVAKVCVARAWSMEENLSLEEIQYGQQV